MDLTPYQRAVAEVVAGLEEGEVSTYGEVAAEAGFPGAARGVSGVLKKVGGLPWWRVTAASGKLIRGLESEQAQRLRGEGVVIRNGKIVG
ncbi:MAG: 6-O-methylguanine DNA methyltransferase [Acidimicrobiia bacterium]|nr:6-O-methylguanine DNA methyltransferase [Acidimicrobiia bacterium]